MLQVSSVSICALLFFFQVSFAAKDVEFSEWKGDILAIAVTENDLVKGSDSKFENALLKKLDGQLGGLLSEASAEEDFTGKAGQSVVLRLPGQGFKRVGLIGLGQNAPSTTTACKGIGESVASVAKSAQASSAAIVFASVGGIQEDFKLTAAAAIASGSVILMLLSWNCCDLVGCIGLMLNFICIWIAGTVLGLHEDSRYKSESKKVHLKQVDLIGFGSGPEVDQKLKYANDLSSGVIFGKELVNSPANVLTPGIFLLLNAKQWISSIDAILMFSYFTTHSSPLSSCACRGGIKHCFYIQ